MYSRNTCIQSGHFPKFYNNNNNNNIKIKIKTLLFMCNKVDINGKLSASDNLGKPLHNSFVLKDATMV